MKSSLYEAELKAPDTYDEWLECLYKIKELPGDKEAVFAALQEGSFSGTDALNAALCEQIVETVNSFLDKSVKSFIRDLNECLSFNELEEAELLFKRLKKNILRSLFFEKLFFLPKQFRDELSASVKEQMIKFWDDTVSFLYKQTLDFSNSPLEDAVYLIKRIRIFDR